MLTLTAKAAQKVRQLAQKQNKPNGFLRLRITSGGCSGMSYEFEVSDQLAKDDLVFEGEGAKLVVDPKSHLFINGSAIDYVQTLMKASFEVTNPQATASCSCGTSFSAEPSSSTETSFSI